MKKTLTLAALSLCAFLPQAFAQNDDPDSKYIRNSVYMIKLDMPVDNPNYAIGFDVIDKTFDGIDFARRYERYNDFALTARHIDWDLIDKVEESEYEMLNAYCAPNVRFEVLNEESKMVNADIIKFLEDAGFSPDTRHDEDYAGAIIKYLLKEAVANKLVAKWHNKPGTAEGTADFDDNLSTIMELGLRGLSEEAKANARVTENLTNLAAGSENKLLGNTYVCFTRYYFSTAEEANAPIVAPLKKQLDKSDNLLLSAGLQGAIDAAMAALKGYFVCVNAYLFRLEWNKDLYNDFYTNKWGDAASFFEKADYRLVYVGKSAKRAPASLSMKPDANLDELIRRATLRGTDAAFAALQRDYEEFRPMCSLHVIDGKLGAYIGMKEGIKEGDRFEVFEAVASKDDPNLVDWKSVGKIKVAKNCLWDNREGAGEALDGEAVDMNEKKVKGNSQLGCTFFEGKVGKFGEGNLIRLSGR